MFTGIIQSLGNVKSIERSGNSCRLSVAVHPDFIADDGSIGDSIAVDGVCLTVIEKGQDGFTAFVSEETLKLTTLAFIRNGASVNLEKALKPSDRLGGHIITGHIDAVGYITEKNRRGESLVMKFNIPKELAAQVVKKGGIAVDGISLTIAEITDNNFTVHLIPHTLKVTTLGIKQTGDKVNIETDIIGKYVERVLSGHNKKQSVDEQFLKEHGFIV